MPVEAGSARARKMVINWLLPGGLNKVDKREERQEISRCVAKVGSFL